MDKIVASVIASAFLVGLCLGYVWWGPAANRATEEIATVKARLVQQAQRADDARKRVADLEAELGRAMESLRHEREENDRLVKAVTKRQK